MKKFSFSLQKLLRYKEQLFDNERNILVEMRSVLARMEQELIDLEEEHIRRAAAFNETAARGTTAQEMELLKMYMGVVDRNIEQKKVQIFMQTQAIDKQADRVREAKMEISTIEKLKERKWEEYTYQENKATEQFIEEFVSNTRASSLGSATS